MQNHKPEFIDNLNGNTMLSAIKTLLDLNAEESSINLEYEKDIDEVRIATAYFSPSGFFKIIKAIKDVPYIKLMLGSTPIDVIELKERRLGEPNERFLTRKFRETLNKQEDLLRLERDQIPFTKEANSSLKQLISLLKNKNLKVKRYEKNFLHAKAYIFSSSGDKKSDNNDSLIVGSSNLTSSGLSLNLELNLLREDAETIKKSKIWFDKLWEEAIDYDLVSYYEDIFEPKNPFEIFLRVLWELYGDEINLDFENQEGLNLPSFQKHGVARAMRLIEETGGVIVADEVGLGKSFIAGEIVKLYEKRRQRCLLICPAALRDSSWKKFRSDYKLFLETISFEELAQDEQLWDENKRPNAKSVNLERNLDEYQLIIIDEAHNYRNPNSPTRHDALRTLLYGRRKDLLMLTATPVNNSLWDLYTLTKYFLKPDSFLANKGIISIKDRFHNAMRTNPNSLSPDVLYPIIDATTVKRTRKFIKKHYPNDQVKINGIMQTIVFPEPQAITVRYNISDLLPGLFDLIEKYLDPENIDCIKFSRYKSDIYRKEIDQDDERIATAVTGLLLSGLLKRFESSVGAFQLSIERIIFQHKNFLKALDEGFVVSTEFLNESIGTDDQEFDELLDASSEKNNINIYNYEELKKDTENDLKKLNEIYILIKTITPNKDPKLKTLNIEIIKILKEAQLESTSREDEMDKRKIIIFSFFSDTVKWINEFLNDSINNNQELLPYKNRVEIVVGNRSGEQKDKASVASKFAPKTAGKNGDEDKTDILISTDVLAEGVNLQQARHIINYDLPWNPMKLVQRHGRIDRIGSQHKRVFMRTIFPVDRLDALIGLEEKISRKIAMAAASVGIISPISNINSTNRDFTETKEEIQKLLEENASLYELGGTKQSVQSGEEYRQTLRKALEVRKKEIINMPWKAGSGISKDNEQGIFYCAKVGDRTYLRFVHADENWKIKIEDSTESENSVSPLIDIEIGRCLRLIECTEDIKPIVSEEIQEAAYDLWFAARDNIFKLWSLETDPTNLQPKIRPLNLKVAEFIRTNIPSSVEKNDLEKALDIIESPWERRDEKDLRRWFESEKSNQEKSKFIIYNVLNSGLEAYISAEPLPPINIDDIKLLVWMAISPNKNNN